MPDPRLVCYSWIAGISDVPRSLSSANDSSESRTSITDEQRDEFGQLVDDTCPSDRISSVSAAPQGPLPSESLLPVAHPLVSAWDNRNRSTLIWYTVRETTVVCLKGLRTSNPPWCRSQKRARFVHADELSLFVAPIPM
jgi:hypothetical protein